jgi:hypothetical protein
METSRLLPTQHWSLCAIVLQCEHASNRFLFVGRVFRFPGIEVMLPQEIILISCLSMISNLRSIGRLSWIFYLVYVSRVALERRTTLVYSPVSV